MFYVWFFAISGIPEHDSSPDPLNGFAMFVALPIIFFVVVFLADRFGRWRARQDGERAVRKDYAIALSTVVLLLLPIAIGAFIIVA